MADVPLVNIEINGIAIQVPKGEMIIESARRLGIEIPYFCYHKLLGSEQAANCRMCLVEIGSKMADSSVRMMPKPQTSCTMAAAEGMVVLTDTEKVEKARRGVIEFLLINHPLDCPVCDRGGECPLQNNTLHFGTERSRYVEQKRHLAKAMPISDYVTLDRERCIHCARCTRFTDEISGDAQLGFMKRGSHKFITTMRDATFTSRFSGNVVELCPVGALTSRVSRFRARPWDTQSQKSVCMKCSNGCNIWLDYRPGRLMRVLGRENMLVNEEWTCDKGKFGYEDLVNERRLKNPLVRENGKFVEVSWSKAYETIAKGLKSVIESDSAQAVGVIAGSSITNEGATILQKFARDVVGTPNIDSKMTPGQFTYAGKPGSDDSSVWMDITIEDIEQAKKIVVIGSDLIDEQPIVFLRVRKAATKFGASVVFINEQRTESSQRLHGCDEITTGEGGIPELLTALNSQFASANGEPEVAKIADMFQSENTVILCGSKVVDSASYLELAEAVKNIVDSCSAKVGMMLPEANSYAMGLLGVKPGEGAMGTEQMLQAAAAGKLKALIVDSCDLLNRYSDKTLVDSALSQMSLLVVRDTQLTETAEYADVVLPAAPLPELEGTVTNIEGRVQQIHKAYEAIGFDTRSAMQCYSELAVYLGKSLAVFTASDVLDEIARVVPEFAGINSKSIAGVGQLLHKPNVDKVALDDN
ncbi:MAG: NADH-quinone oxidoreductase subunit NuoG [Armatimonadota bacterium]